MTALKLNNHTLSSLKSVFPEWDVKIFCFPLSLPIKHGVNFKITNTAHTKKYVQTCDFHNKGKSSQDILMLAKHTHTKAHKTALHAVVFLIIIQPRVAFKPSRLEFSFSLGGNFFYWIMTYIIQIFISNLRCCAFFIRFVFALLSSFEKIWKSFFGSFQP